MALDSLISPQPLRPGGIIVSMNTTLFLQVSRRGVIIYMMKKAFLLISLTLLSIALGCIKKPPQPWISKISVMKIPIGPEEILRLPGGDPTSFKRLLDELVMVRVVFVGENHDRFEHHRIQLKILQGLLERGKEVAVAMEMFERPHQPVLDRWSQGFLLEEEFLKEVNWETTWGMDYQ